MIKFLVKLAVSALIAHATFRIGSAYLSYYRLTDAVRGAALTPRITDEQLRERVLELAAQHDAPLDEDHVEIRRDARNIYIDASYVQNVEVVPGYQHPWAFDWSMEVLALPDVTGPPLEPAVR